MLRVAAYARVSTDHEDQINSLANQRTYFENYIKSNPDWRFAGIYYDEGVSGTQTKKRAGFNRMITACKNGEINLILTKEVSRFARNTVDTLEYTRMLKAHDVGVIFINDNIDTRENDGEFRLAIMASVAQEESRKTSERVRWGQKIAMKNGVVFGNSVFGFSLKNGELFINDSEAEVVRLIFHKYVNEGKGTHVISRELYEEGKSPPKTSKGQWSSAMILKILRNEKYVGDLLQKKFITKDYLTHKKIQNDGSEEKIYIRDHHKPIIDRATWERTQEELKRREVSVELKSKYSNRYWCSGKIVCADCGSRFIIRRSKRKGGDYITWSCNEHSTHGRVKTDTFGKSIGCNMRMINNKSLLCCMQYVTSQVSDGFEDIVDEIIEEISSVADSDERSSIDTVRNKIDIVEAKKLNMLDSFFEKKISEADMLTFKQKYDSELDKLKKQFDKLQNEADIIHDMTDSIAKLRDTIHNSAVYSEEVYGEITDKIVVCDEFIIIKLKYLDFAFKLTYSAHGYKEKYTTVIKSCERIPAEEIQ